MKVKPSFLPYNLILIAILYSAESIASIVRMEFLFGNTPGGEVYIDLYDQDTPITVSNFLNYIENSTGERRYDGTFIHRSIPNFVIQGGGYKYDPAQGEFSTTSAPHIEQDPQIVNEFDPSRSNLRGTIAMAKIGGNPDSATSEWFFNLQDNLGLDSQNSGFTVFGKVLGTGMNIIDSIAALPTISASTFTDLPVTDYILSEPVTEDNLITIQPSVYLSGYPVDFGEIDVFTSSETQSVTIQNSETSDLILGQFNLASVAPPFSATDNCSGITLSPLEACTVDFTYSPTTEGTFTANVSAPVTPGITSIDFSLDGRAVFSTANLTILNTSPVIINDTGINQSSTGIVNIKNEGTDTLQITGYNITGPDASLFSLQNSCPIIEPDEVCEETLNFLSSNLGDFSATLEILSNDPDTPSSTLELIATVSNDNDGIKDSIEMAAPFGGDNNKDGILDYQQENVASFPDINGQYISLVTDHSLVLTSVQAIENPSVFGSLPADPNSTITFPFGFFSFNIENVQNDGSATVTILLPDNTQLPEFTTYYKFFPPPRGSIFDGLWFHYDKRSTTISGTGAEFNNNTVTIDFIDGVTGDIDGSANGTIVDPGGIAYITPTITASIEQSSGGCSLKINGSTSNKHFEWIILALYLLLYRRRLSL